VRYKQVVNDYDGINSVGFEVDSLTLGPICFKFKDISCTLPILKCDFCDEMGK